MPHKIRAGERLHKPHSKADIIPDGIIAADKTDGYRNKAQLPIGIDEKGEPFADFMQKKATELSKSATAVSSLPSFQKSPKFL